MIDLSLSSEYGHALTKGVRDTFSFAAAGQRVDVLDEMTDDFRVTGRGIGVAFIPRESGCVEGGEVLNGNVFVAEHRAARGIDASIRDHKDLDNARVVFGNDRYAATVVVLPVVCAVVMLAGGR